MKITLAKKYTSRYGRPVSPNMAIVTGTPTKSTVEEVKQAMKAPWISSRTTLSLTKTTEIRKLSATTRNGRNAMLRSSINWSCVNFEVTE